MSEQRVMKILPSTWPYEKFKDMLHFYSLAGIIPLGTLAFIVNVFIGPAKLTEIPEDYIPDDWEYQRVGFSLLTI